MGGPDALKDRCKFWVAFETSNVMAIFHGLRFTTMVATADTCLPQRWWIIVVGDAFTEFIREVSPLSPYSITALCLITKHALLALIT